MKDITVENFNYLNIKDWISGWEHKEKVKLAIYSAELVIDLYAGDSDMPSKAIKATKDWISNPSEENKERCKKAAIDAYAVAVAAAAADAAAYTAAYAAYAADAAAYAAYAAADAAYAAAINTAVVKGKIVNYIIKKGK